MTRLSWLGTCCLLLACGAPPAPEPGDPKLRCPSSPTPVLTSRVYTDVIQPNCVVGCHSAQGSALDRGDWDTEAKFQTVVGKSSFYAVTGSPLKFVEPSHLELSTVWLKVLGGGPTYKGPKGEVLGGRMPEGKDLLTEAQRQPIRDWICSGAKAQ